MRTDVYQKITDQIVAALESGVRPWHQPWQVEHGAGRITRPLRGNGVPYQGINVLMLWSAAMEKGYAAPVWMTFKQALDKGANVVVLDRDVAKIFPDSKAVNDALRALAEAGKRHGKAKGGRRST